MILRRAHRRPCLRLSLPVLVFLPLLLPSSHFPVFVNGKIAFFPVGQADSNEDAGSESQEDGGNSAKSGAQSGGTEEVENFWPANKPAKGGGSSTVDPWAWRQVVEQPLGDIVDRAAQGNPDALYALGLKKLVGAPGILRDVPEAVKSLSIAADTGHAGAQSAMGLLYGIGFGVRRSTSRSFLYHSFAAAGGSYQSKMALGYSLLRQQEHEQAVKVYAEVAAQSMSSFSTPGEATLVESVRLMQPMGAEENTEAIRGHRGEDDEHIQYLKFTADEGAPESNRALGNLHYWGLRGVPRDPVRAFQYFEKAAKLGDKVAMANLGEMYAMGVGVEADYLKSVKWFEDAAKEGVIQAFNGLGFMYAKGKGVPRNYSKAYEMFGMAAGTGDAEGLYNLGVMHMNGLGRKRSATEAFRKFDHAQQAGTIVGHHLGAIYQIAKMKHKGVGTRPNLVTAAQLYKAVAERGPWGSLLRWAHEGYIAGKIGPSYLLYERAAELGYEVAQSNAAWLLDRKQGDDVCYGPRGRQCLEGEREARAHTLWQHASEQGNEHAALLIGDGYYYGRGTKKDLERAVAAYRRASEQKNPQAIFNLGYMHEHGLGLPRDLHLAKRQYDMALERDPSAVIAVKIALFGLWLRTNYGDTALMRFLDSLPEEAPKFMGYAKEWLMDEGNALVVTLSAILVGVLYLRQRRRMGAQEQAPQSPHGLPEDQGLNG